MSVPINSSATPALVKAVGASVLQPLTGQSGCLVSIHGAFTGLSVVLEVSDDGFTWYPIAGFRPDLAGYDSISQPLTVPDSTPRQWLLDVRGQRAVRARVASLQAGQPVFQVVPGSFQPGPAPLTVSGFALTSAPNTFTVGPNTFQAGAATNKALIAQAAANPAANIWEIQNVSGVAQVWVDSGFNLNGSGSGLTTLNASNVSSGTLADARLSTNVPLKNVANTFTTGPNTFQSGGAANSALNIQAASAQTALLTQWKDNTGNVLTSVDGFGDFLFGSQLVLGWSSTTSAIGTVDIGLLRAGTNQLQVANNDVGVGSSGYGSLIFGATDASTNTIAIGGSVVHTTSGTPAAGFGVGLQFQLASSTGTVRPTAEIDGLWANATDATRAGRLTLGVFDTAVTAREGFRVESVAGVVALGFYGHTAAAQQNVTGAKGGNVALANLLTALATLGLITDGTT